MLQEAAGEKMQQHAAVAEEQLTIRLRQLLAAEGVQAGVRRVNQVRCTLADSHAMPLLCCSLSLCSATWQPAMHQHLLAGRTQALGLSTDAHLTGGH